MTSRSRKYFNRKRSDRYRESIFATMIPFFDDLIKAKDAYLELTKPRPRYPPGTHHPGGLAIVGIIGTDQEMKMLLPSGHVILPGPVSSVMIEKPVADMRRAIDEQIIMDITNSANSQFLHKINP